MDFFESRPTFKATTMNLLKAVNRIELMVACGRGPSEFVRDRRFRGHDRPETRSKPLLAKTLEKTPE